MGPQAEQPGERGVDVSAVCGASGGERPVGHVRDAVFAAEFLHRVVTVMDIEDVLHGCDIDLSVPTAEVLAADLRQADVPDLPLLLESLERADLIFDGHLPVDAVQVAELQSLHAQPTKTRLHTGAEVRGVAEGHPDVGGRAHDTDLRRDQQLVGVRVQSLLDQVLDGVRAVGVGRVDVRDAVLMDGLPEQADGSGTILRVAPATGPGQAQGAEAEAGDGLSGDLDRSGRGVHAALRVVCSRRRPIAGYGRQSG